LASTVLILIVIPALYAILHDLGLSTLARDEGEGVNPALPESV
jgi:hydrophobic/amphiphilic exporter-1 (mainly G- bacteria), HAE1 family